jgi:hypothetical protein
LLSSEGAKWANAPVMHCTPYYVLMVLALGLVCATVLLP